MKGDLCNQGCNYGNNSLLYEVINHEVLTKLHVHTTKLIALPQIIIYGATIYLQHYPTRDPARREQVPVTAEESLSSLLLT